MLLFFTVNISAQTLQRPSTLPVPSNPGKAPLPSPKIQIYKPDIKFISSRVISVTEDVSRHLFETTLSITLKNQGNIGTGGFYLDLRSRYGTTSGGTDYSIIGAPATIHPLAPGETRTVEYVFAKDITAMGRARLECIIRLDFDNMIAESDEENNNSPFFYITPPRP